MAVGPGALAVLGVPARFALLSLLMSGGPRTASDCAEIVGESPSNCSWHLRVLQKAGLVERSEAGTDGRTRPWRATAVGMTFDDGDDPAERLASRTVEHVITRHDDDAYHRFVEARDTLPAAWGEASGGGAYSLDLSPAELAELREKLDGMLRPFVRGIRSDTPPDAAAVRVVVRAFVDTDLLGR